MADTTPCKRNKPRMARVGVACMDQNTRSTELILEKNCTLVYILVQNVTKHSLCWDFNPLLVDSVDFVEGITNFFRD